MSRAPAPLADAAPPGPWPPRSLTTATDPERTYDLVILGASGHTGKLVARHITRTFPTDFRWALAGRSRAKLEVVAAECRRMDADRRQPALESCDLNDMEMSALASKTTALLTTIGPYSLYGGVTFRACADAGTHYFDVTGEVPFVARMIAQHEPAARRTGALMFPQIGIESAPPDLLTWLMATEIRGRLLAKTTEVTVVVRDLGNARASSGTLASIFAFMEVFSLDEIRKSLAPYALSPVPNARSGKVPKRSLLSRLTGTWRHPDLGLLTTSFFGSTDRPVVQRTWGLLGGTNGLYGPRFTFKEYMPARNWLAGVIWHWSCMVFSVALALPLFRAVARRVSRGSTVESEDHGPSRGGRIEYDGIAVPDWDEVGGDRRGENRRIKGRFIANVGPYKLTAILAAEAALTVLRDQHDLRGGVWTAAMLGRAYIDRLRNAGITLQTELLK